MVKNFNLVQLKIISDANKVVLNPSSDGRLTIKSLKVKKPKELTLCPKNKKIRYCRGVTYDKCK